MNILYLKFDSQFASNLSNFQFYKIQNIHEQLSNVGRFWNFRPKQKKTTEVNNFFGNNLRLYAKSIRINDEKIFYSHHN